LKRPELASKSLPETLDPRIVENAALKRRIAELETEVNNLHRRLNNVRCDRDYWHHVATTQRAMQNPDYSALGGFAQSLQPLHAQSQQVHAQAMQNQRAMWHDCTCVPGRAAAFGVLGGDNP
jgi:hypothetical protein